MAKAKKHTKPKKTKVVLMHMLAVHDGDGEAGWLVHAGKKNSKISKHVQETELESASWEPPVKSWWVADEDYVGDLVDHLLDSVQGGKFCKECMLSGDLCDVWGELEEWSYRRRKHKAHDLFDEEFSAAEPEPPPPPRAKVTVFDAFGPDAVRMFGEFVSGFLGVRAAVAIDPTVEAAAMLGLTLPATKDQITEAYRKAAFAAHPDRGGSTEQMAKINRARDTLLQGAP